jgi:hypothetical protein
MGRITVTTALVVAIVACGTLRGADDPETVPDGPPDAAADVASTPDSPEDAPPDAPPDASCAPTPGGFCAMLSPAAKFCADFDEPACSLPGAFAAIAPESGAMIQVDSVQSESKPSALHVKRSGSAHTGASGLVTTLMVPKPGAGVANLSVDLFFRIPALPADGTPKPRLGPIHLDATDSLGPTIDFYTQVDKAYFTIDDTEFSADDPAGPSAIDAWHEVIFAFTMRADRTNFSAAIDGRALFTDYVMKDPLVGGQTLKLTVGYSDYELAQGEIFVDNLVVRVSP